MSRVCNICGKKAQRGMKVSHAHNRSIKHSQPNLKTVNIKVGTNRAKIKVCTRCLRNGIATAK